MANNKLFYFFSHIVTGVWPPYASYLTIEVAQTRGDSSAKFVRAIYNDKEKVIVGCSSVWCPYETFHKRLESLSMTHDEYVAIAQSPSNGENAVDEDLKATLGEK